MKNRMKRNGLRAAAAAAVVSGAIALGCESEFQPANPEVLIPPPGHVVTAAEYEGWKTELSNWGRWGEADELGALNLITPEKRK